MTTTVAVVSITTAAIASACTTTSGMGSIMSTTAGETSGSSMSTYSRGPATLLPGNSLSAVEERNYFLRRLTLGGSSDCRAERDPHHGFMEAQIMQTVGRKLEDEARKYYGALLPIHRQMENWFRSVFCIQNPDVTLREFAQRLKVIANEMFPPSSVNTPVQTYHREILLVNQFNGIEGRLANGVFRSGVFHSLDECLQ
ncbi:hypothetical protein JTB14_010970 [Gonioctena quinquepunctata]|nr:hypothetical protein JTB14_010970 [Gonioctena quinquepunctata]